MRPRAALNAVATGPVWSISPSLQVDRKPSVVAVPTHVPGGSRAYRLQQQCPDQTRAVGRHHGVGDGARTKAVGRAVHRVEDAAPIAVVLNDPHPGNALCNLAVNGIDEFLDGFVEDKVGRLLRFSLGPDLADLPRDVLEQPD